jgi:hypothetical protein
MLKQQQIKTFNDMLAQIISVSDLNRIEGLVRIRKSQLGIKFATDFWRGQKVQFVHNNIPVLGTIKTVNQKTVTLHKCSDNGPGWRVPFSKVETVEKLT